VAGPGGRQMELGQPSIDVQLIGGARSNGRPATTTASSLIVVRLCNRGYSTWIAMKTRGDPPTYRCRALRRSPSARLRHGHRTPLED